MEQDNRKPQSRFVRRVMDGAGEEEIEEATERWFEFLRILDRIVERMDRDKETNQ